MQATSPFHHRGTTLRRRRMLDLHYAVPYLHHEEHQRNLKVQVRRATIA